MRVQIPHNSNNLGGTFSLAEVQVISRRGNRCIIRATDIPKEITWLCESDFVYAQFLGDGKTLKAIREATEEDLKQFRVPVWIQEEEVPQCCGSEMYFVGQIDDDVICAEPPKGAEIWWHDRASFYVFTCSKCLSVKAVGQQF